jgi:hypothetical protein
MYERECSSRLVRYTLAERAPSIVGLKRGGSCAETRFRLSEKKGPVHSNRRGCQLSQAVAGEVCIS